MNITAAKLPPARAATLSNFDQLPADARVGGPVCRLLVGGIGRTTFWRRVRTGMFPPAIEGTYPPVWRVGDVRQFLASGG